MSRLRQRGKHIGRFMEPAPLLAHLGEHIPQRRPGFGRLPVPVGQRDEFLLPLGADPNHHQQAQLLLLQTDLEVNAVDPQIDEVDLRKIPHSKHVRLLLPLRGQTGHRRRRQPQARAQELLQRRGEVQRRQPVQIQQRQHLGGLRRLPRPRRQDLRRNPPPLNSFRINPLVVHPRRSHRHRAGIGHHVPLQMRAIANDQPVTAPIHSAK